MGVPTQRAPAEKLQGCPAEKLYLAQLLLELNAVSSGKVLRWLIVYVHIPGRLLYNGNGVCLLFTSHTL